MSFTPLPESHELLPDHSVYRPDPRRQNKIIIIFIITSIVLLFIFTISVIIIFGKNKQPILSSVSTMIYTSATAMIHTSAAGSNTIPTTIKSSPTKVTTPSVTLTNSVTTSSATSESKLNECQLPLIPSYNSDKTIVAGSELRGSSVYELNKPIAIALDSKSNLFVADADNFRVLKYLPNSKKGEIVLGHGTDRFPRASIIVGLLIDKNDLLYTCQYDDSGHGQVIIWPSSSKNGTLILNSYGRVSGMAIDRNLNIYIASGINLCIWLAPAYREPISQRVFGKPFISGSLPTSSSSIYIDAHSNLFAIDTENHRIQKTPLDDKYSETIVQRSPTLLAIAGDCHSNLYTIDSNASLIIYNSTGDIISTMHNAIDNPYNSSSWSYISRNDKRARLPDYFASLVLDSNNGDLYVIMYNYDRVTKFTLN